jgi:hypothetical protein
MGLDRPAHILRAHGVYLSPADEDEIWQRLRAMLEPQGDSDVADLALRTCLCGRRLEGFDAYFDHLAEVFDRFSGQ